MASLGEKVARFLPIGLLLVAIVSVPVRILAADGLPRYRALTAKREEVRRENERLRREVRSLRREVEALRSDPRAVERIARDELGMVREGELIFQFPE